MRETREEEAKRKALEKLIHDKRWERDGFGQLKNGKSALQEVRATRDIKYAWDVADYALSPRRKA